MNNPDDLDVAASTRGRCAVWLHVLLLPYWLFVWFLAGVLPASSGATGAQGAVLALWGGFAVAIFVLGVGFWATLLRRLVRQRREGRDVSCLLPVLWAVCTVFTIFSAIAYFAGAYLVPALKRRFVPTSSPRDPQRS